MHSPSRSHQQQAQSSTSAGHASPIFVDNQGQPLQICISRTVKDRSTLESKIKLHGGVVTQNERVAYIRLADPGHTYQGKLFSTTWVDRCIQEQQLLKHNEPEFQLGIGVSTGRVPFTAEDSEALREFVRAKKAQGIPIGGDNIYQEFAETHPRHTWQSWKNHSVKVLGLTKETVSPYEANKARRDAMMESMKREVTIQVDRSDNTTSTADNTSTSIQQTADRQLQAEPNNDESPADQHADDGQPQAETDRAESPAFQTQPPSQGSPMVFSEIASDEDDAMHKEEVNELNRRRASYGTSQQPLLQSNASSGADLPHHTITESGEIELLDEDDLMIEKSILEKMSRSSMAKPQVQQILSQEQQGIQDSREHDPHHLGPSPWTEPDAPPVTEMLSFSKYDVPEKLFTDPSTSKKRIKASRTRSIGSSRSVGSSPSGIGQTTTKRTTDEPISRLAKEKATARTFDQHDHRGASHVPPSVEIAAESCESNSPIRITRRSGSPRHEEAESSTAMTTAPRNSTPVRRIQPVQQNAKETAPLGHMNPSEQSDTIQCNTDPPTKAASGYRDATAQRLAQEGDVGYSKPVFARGAVPSYYKAGQQNPQTPEEEEACKLLLYLSERYQEEIRYLKLEELILPLTAIDLLDACSGNVNHVLALIQFGMNGQLARHFWSRDEDKDVFKDNGLLVDRHGYEEVGERRAYLAETRGGAKKLTLSPGALENLEAMGQLKRAGPRCGSTPQPKRPRLQEE